VRLGVTDAVALLDRGVADGDTATVSALLDRLLHHAHIVKCGPRSHLLRRRILPTEGSAK